MISLLSSEKTFEDVVDQLGATTWWQLVKEECVSLAFRLQLDSGPIHRTAHFAIHNLEIVVVVY